MQFFERLGAAAKGPGTVYIAGGSTALLLGIRNQTVDVDLKLDPEPKGVFEAIANLKDALDINVELASPDQFIPTLPGWRERSTLIASEGDVEIRHYDLYSQALAKIERGYEQDLSDVEALVTLDLVDPNQLLKFFEEIKPQLARFPSIDPDQFANKVGEQVERLTSLAGTK